MENPMSNLSDGNPSLRSTSDPTDSPRPMNLMWVIALVIAALIIGGIFYTYDYSGMRTAPAAPSTVTSTPATPSTPPK
jgi:hypothetical protein